MNTTPDKVTEAQFINLDVEDVEIGDLYAVAGKEANIASVKAGTKWIELRADGGKLIARLEVGTKITVVREVETEESKAARKRAFQNETIRKSVEKKAVNSAQLKVLAELTEQAQKGYLADSFKMTALLAAQAEDEINDGFAAFVTNNVGRVNEQTGEVVDETAAYEAYKAMLTKRLIGGGYDITRGLSRSTSMASNLMDDAKREATVEFIRHGAGWWF